MTGTSTRRLQLRWSAAALTATAALAIVAGPAMAKVIGQEHYSDSDSFTVTDCPGLTFDVDAASHGQRLLRVTKGGEAFLVKDTFFFRDVWTNATTKKWFAIEGHATYHETKATLVSGTIYKFTAIEAGQPFTIVDSNGRTVVRDRGVIRHVFLFDTLGDGVPGGVFIEELETSVHGPHPGFADDFPFCEIAASLTT